MPKVSIVVNCYNSDKYLKEALDSIKTQTFDDYEVVFIDNCSEDNSASIAKAFGEKLKYYKTNETISLGAGRNYAIDMCKGDYIAFLDCDDLWESEKLRIQVEIMEENPKCAVTMSNIYMLNMTDNTKKVTLRMNERKKLALQDFAINYEYGMSSFMLRNSTIKRLGLRFDERLSYAEEYDFFMRLSCFGEVIYTPEVLATYRVHANMNSKHLKETIPNEYNIVRNNLLRCCDGMEVKYPEVFDYLLFLRDYTQTKIYMESNENDKARATIKPYIKKYSKAKAFYIVSLFPKRISYWLYTMYYSHKVV